MTYQPSNFSLHLSGVSGRSYSKNPPGVSLTPNPVSEGEFKTQLETTQGRGRALKLQLEEEKNRQTGWLLAIEREKTSGLSYKHQQQGQKTQIERHRLDAIEEDAKTEKGKIEHAKLRGKIASQEKAIIEVELGTKKDDLKAAKDFREIKQERNKVALKIARFDVKALEAEFNERRELLRSQGYEIKGV